MVPGQNSTGKLDDGNGLASSCLLDTKTVSSVCHIERGVKQLGGRLERKRGRSCGHDEVQTSELVLGRLLRRRRNGAGLCLLPFREVQGSVRRGNEKESGCKELSFEPMSSAYGGPRVEGQGRAGRERDWAERRWIRVRCGVSGVLTPKGRGGVDCIGCREAVFAVRYRCSTGFQGWTRRPSGRAWH
jgi:hypothetical protein